MCECRGIVIRARQNKRANNLSIMLTRFVSERAYFIIPLSLAVKPTTREPYTVQLKRSGPKYVNQQIYDNWH